MSVRKSIIQQSDDQCMLIYDIENPGFGRLYSLGWLNYNGITVAG